MEVRRATERLCEPLAVEDFVVQAMPDASPARWHLAHVSWFFETFVLRPRAADYRPLDERYADLFNSYYNGVGPQLARAERGTLSRPTVSEVFAYRAHVDKAMAALLDDDRRLGDIAAVDEPGLHDEQQHQKIVLPHLQNNPPANPLPPPYRAQVRIVR